MASYAFKFTSGKEFKKDKDYKISGRVTNIQFLKTRSGFNNVKIPAFLHGKFGFSNELTNLMLFKDEGMLKGSGHGYFFKGHEDQKFKLAEFSKKYNEDEDFQAMFDDVATEYWTKILLEKSGMEAEEEASKENDFDDYDDEDED